MKIYCGRILMSALLILTIVSSVLFCTSCGEREKGKNKFKGFF